MVVNADTQSPQSVSYARIGTIASCHCGNLKLPVTLASQTAVFDLSSTWQKLTGTLVVFYTKLLEFPAIEIARAVLSEYIVDKQHKFTAYFCKTCSAHVCFTINEAWFVHTATLEDEVVEDLTFQWVHSCSVTTITTAAATTATTTTEGDDSKTPNQETSSYSSKGLAECVQDYILPNTSASKQDDDQIVMEENLEGEKKTTYLHGSCYCGSIQLRLTRPTAQSYPPYTVGPFPDFLQSFYKTPAEEQNKPADTAWWIIDNNNVDSGHDNNESKIERDSKKFITAFCSCTSCRKIAGSELQQWAFLPEDCLSLKYKLGGEFVAWPDFWPGSSSSATSSTAIDGNMTLYESSKDVIRGSCQVCGATIFWNGRTRKNLIDVGVGLFVESHVQDRRSPGRQDNFDKGMLEDGWFKWSIDRLSFVEDAKGRIELVKDLEEKWKSAGT